MVNTCDLNARSVVLISCIEMEHTVYVIIFAASRRTDMLYNFEFKIDGGSKFHTRFMCIKSIDSIVDNLMPHSAC